VQGCKNTSLAVFAAGLLAGGRVRFGNFPAISDADVCSRIASTNGYEVDRHASGTLSVTPVRAPSAPAAVSARDGGAIRASTSIAAALLARFGSVVFPVPGGDGFTPRPIDRHLDAMIRAGAEIEQDGPWFRVRAAKGRLNGFTFSARTEHGPSVGASVTALILAATARGESVIEDPSPEPEVAGVVDVLNACGADIVRRPRGGYAISGVPELHGADYTVPGDRQEAGTLALAAAVTAGSVLIRGVSADVLSASLRLLDTVGCTVKETADGIYVAGPAELRACRVVAAPTPELSTDLQPIVGAALCSASGRSTVVDRVFPGRTSHLSGLCAMGAKIKSGPTGMRIEGVRRLASARVAGTDIRCATALLVAALGAEGESSISGVEHIRRGHASLVEKLQGLGGVLWAT
jgi:UDP-N-acetylglucosamine 1-carboxyvinyltransferase